MQDIAGPGLLEEGLSAPDCLLENFFHACSDLGGSKLFVQDCLYPLVIGGRLPISFQYLVRQR